MRVSFILIGLFSNAGRAKSDGADAMRVPAPRSEPAASLPDAIQKVFRRLEDHLREGEDQK
jgi:hypothetical protein